MLLAGEIYGLSYPGETTMIGDAKGDSKRLESVWLVELVLVWVEAKEAVYGHLEAFEGCF